MQQPPNQEYPQQQWQQQHTSWGSSPKWQQFEPLPPQYPQQMPPPQQQTNYAQPQSDYPPPPTPPQQPPFSQQQYQKQQWYQPDYTQPPTYNSPQQLPIQRPKRNRVKLWISVSIAGTVLAILVVVSSVLIGYSLLFSPSHSLETIFTSTQYPALHTEYNGTIAVSLTSSSSPLAVPMVLIITSNDNQGHISGRIGILLAPYGGDPFIGTLGVDRTITFTATPYPLGVLTIFSGRVNSDSSISGTTSSSTYYPSEPWKLFPVKGK